MPRSPAVDTEELSATSATTADEATETDEATDRTGDAERRRRRTVTVLAVVTVLALAAAVASGIYWWSGTQSDTAAAAATRDEAIDAAEQIVVNINTVRPSTLDADLDAAQSSLTEPMLGEYQKVRERFAENLRTSQAEVIATPVSAALTAFDPERRTASAIVAIDVNARSAQAPPQAKQQLFLVEMIRTPDGWKAAKATPTTGQQ
ncbi:hypothetical protein [Actinomycetospora cinnamomea]|uniref:Mce-associated membrane protein n=1 Tax=Actinomycetospora cinnamomea TaxID=663609 RepID=A0A2U1FDH2_9PSEU|nr:hypothetical protein [Actinomycetospora cinnamomea]PVZ10232.1 hypothetical protein C8D89_105312 [Actinomycetospora cinnamomea]